MAFTPACQATLFQPDTPPQKPRVVGKVKVVQKAAVKNCSLLLYKSIG
jgi:hypothetical protein